MSLATQRRPRDAEFTYSSLLDTDSYVIDGAGRTKAGKIARAHASADVFRRSARVVIADLMSGSDLGAKINNAMNELDDEPGEVWAFAGQITTGITVTSDHTLRVLGHLTSNYVRTINGVGATVPMIVMQDRTNLIGAGPLGAGISSIQESSDNTTFSIVNGSSMVSAGFAGANTDIHIADLKFVGFPGHAAGPGFGVVHLGNCKRGSIRRVWVDSVHDLACGCGGFGTSGNRAEDVWLEGNYFTDNGITLWVINGKNCYLLNNIFERCSTPIDLEPNSGNDMLRRIVVAGNQIDCTGLVTAQQGIAVQKSLAIDVGEIKILHNTITGTNLEDATSPLVGGITLFGVSDVTVAHNTTRRAYGYGIRVQQCGRCYISNNVNEACGGPPGGGGVSSIDVKGSRLCRVHRNISTTPAEFTGTDDPRIVEDETVTVIVSTNGTAVTCTSGATFGKWMKGGPFKINGVVYTVSSVTSAQALTLSSSAGTQTNVTATYLTRDNEYRDNECSDVVTLHESSIVLVNGSASLNDGLIGGWKLGEPSGTRGDVLGGHPLTDVNTVTQAAGPISLAAQFTAANNERLTCPDTAPSSLGADAAFTVSLWAYLDTNNVVNRAIAHKGNSGGGVTSCEWLFYLTGTGSTPTFGVGNGTTGTPVVWSATLGTATWAHVLGWHDPAADKIYIQVNGGTPVEAAWTGGTQNSSAGLFLGGDGNLPVYDGRLADVYFWKRLLTQGERALLYNAGAGKSWPFAP